MKKCKLQTVRGFRDLYGFDVEKFRFITENYYKIMQSFNVKEVITPILEYTELFFHSLGSDSDIVTKEMFVIDDMVMKPEGTLPIVRFMTNIGVSKGRFGYVTPCFRRERPQAGRYRQFWQVGVEMIGYNNLEEDYDCILMINSLMKQLNIEYTLSINTIGEIDDRMNYVNVLKEYFNKQYNQLSEISKNRLENNAILRILDSKDDDDVLKDAPVIYDYLSSSSLAKFYKIEQFLIDNHINYVKNPKLVRGLDYYNDFVFEGFHTNSKLALFGGGRYNGLFKSLGLIDTPAIGFGIGVDRLINIIDFQPNPLIKIGVIFNNHPNYELLQTLRKSFAISLLNGNLTSGLEQANKMSLNYVVMANDNFILKNLDTGTQSQYNSIIDLINAITKSS